MKFSYVSMRFRADVSRRSARLEGTQTIIRKLLRVAETASRELNAPELPPLIASREPVSYAIRMRIILDTYMNLTCSTRIPTDRRLHNKTQ